MNKQELVAKMAEKSGLTKTDAQKALDAFLGATEEALKGGDKVTLIGFGTFGIVERKERMGVNPQTGAKVKIAAKKVVKFKAGSNMTL